MDQLPGGEAAGNSGGSPPRITHLLLGLVGVAERLHGERDVHAVLRVAAEGARELLGARHAAICLASDSRHLRPIHVVATAYDHPHGRGPSDADGPGFPAYLGGANEPVRRTEAGLAAPLLSRDGKGLGLIRLRDKAEGPFTEDDEAVLVQLSRLAAAAVENAAAYQKLRGDAERKDEFLAVLGHELRNPLAAIGNAVRLATFSGTAADTCWSLEVITRQMRHLTRLVDDLTDVSRIARGKVRLRRDVMEVTPLLESAAATVGPLVAERGHTLALEIDRGRLWAKVDPTRLEQVMVNLLNNAARYSEDGGSIRLSGQVEADEVVLRVKDGGIGIPPERLSEVFELFAQGDRSPGRAEGGLGVGLAVVKRLVELHGGTVTAASDGRGRGSEFVVRLPAAKRPPAVRPESGPAADAAVKRRVLVVDDNVDTARVLERLLERIGHEVAVAHRGPEAVDVARAFRPAFVLLDIGLPGMDGYEVASRLRKDGGCGGSVLIAVSGYGQEEDRRRSRAAGFDHHLTKPLDHEALLRLLSAGANGRVAE